MFILSFSDDDETPPPPPDSEPPNEEPPSYNDVEEDDQQARSETPPPEDEPEPEPVVISNDTPSHGYHPRLCHIKKWPDFQGYGFNLHAEKDKPGQYIGLVDADSPAEDADLRKGDRIIEVNGENIEDSTHQQVIQKIKAGGDETIMLVVDLDADEYYKNNGIRITSDLPEVIRSETTPRSSSGNSLFLKYYSCGDKIIVYTSFEVALLGCLINIVTVVSCLRNKGLS